MQREFGSVSLGGKECLLLWGQLIKEATNQNVTHDKGGHGKNKHGQWHELVWVCGMWKSFFERQDVEREGDNQKHTWSVPLINELSRICRQSSTLQLTRMQAWSSYMLEGVSGIVPNGLGKWGAGRYRKGDNQKRVWKRTAMCKTVPMSMFFWQSPAPDWWSLSCLLISYYALS